MFNTKFLVSYLIELVVGVILISIDLRIFLIYAFLAILFTIDTKIDYLRKLIRVFAVENEVGIKSLQNKIGVTQEEQLKAVKELEDRWTEEQKESVSKDISDLSNTR